MVGTARAILGRLHHHYARALVFGTHNPAFKKLMAHTATIAELTGRNIAVGYEL